MNLLQPERLDALARAHALGTLSPRAARRFARVVAGSSVAAQAVADWQAVLGTLEEGAPASPEPRPRVWADVQRRLFERDAPAAPQADRRGAARGARGAGGGAAPGWLRWPAGLVVGAAMSWTLLALRPQAFGLEPAAGAVPASYVGVLPDLFREGQGVVAVGAMNRAGAFQASEVLAKHSADYMPPEVEQALKKDGLWNPATGRPPPAAAFNGGLAKSETKLAGG